MSVIPDVIPTRVRVAAKRGFIRTTYQAYAATIPAGGVSAGAIYTLVDTPDLLLVAATAGAALVSPLLAGLASYLSITAAGIPEEYTDAAPEPGTGRHRAED